MACVQAVHLSQMYHCVYPNMTRHLVFEPEFYRNMEWDAGAHLMSEAVSRLSSIRSLHFRMQQDFQLAADALVPPLTGLRSLTILGPMANACAATMGSVLARLTQLHWGYCPSEQTVNHVRGEADGGAALALARLRCCEVLTVRLSHRNTSRLRLAVVTSHIVQLARTLRHLDISGTGEVSMHDCLLSTSRLQLLLAVYCRWHTSHTRANCSGSATTCKQLTCNDLRPRHQVTVTWRHCRS